MFNPSGCLLYTSCGLTSHLKREVIRTCHRMLSVFLYVFNGLCSGLKYLAVGGALNAEGLAILRQSHRSGQDREVKHCTSLFL